jgi:hypothetical protein
MIKKIQTHIRKRKSEFTGFMLKQKCKILLLQKIVAASILLAVWLSGAFTVYGQTKDKPADDPRTNIPPAGTQLWPDSVNGEQTIPAGDWWDGVDDDGTIHVLMGSAPVLDDVGRMTATHLSCCPSFVDMNGDSLRDLVVSDPQGFLWIFINSGKKGEPKFTTGEFVPTFFGFGSHVHMADWDNDGDYDALCGTFYGDVAIFLNVGNRSQWQFTRRMGIPRYVDPQYGIDDPNARLPVVNVGKKPLLFGVYMAPWFEDFTGDGKPDLLLGEGTYSANSVHIFKNIGTFGNPDFSEEQHFFLAFGEGFEHLTPAVVDYNGDGIKDLLVGTRTGQIRMHKGGSQKKEGIVSASEMRGKRGAPAFVEFDKNLVIAGKDIFTKMSVVYPCDWNEDGLFDLLIGTQEGRVYIAINKGSKSEPSFPEAVPVTGTNVEKNKLAPAHWWGGTGQTHWDNVVGGYCNSAIFLTCEKELQKGAITVRPVAGDYFLYTRYIKHYPGWMINRLSWVPLAASESVPYIIGGRYFAPDALLEMAIGHRYEFSFSSILEGRQAAFGMYAHEVVEPATEDRPEIMEVRCISEKIPPSAGWQKRVFRFTCPGKNKHMILRFRISFRLPEGEAMICLDDFSLKEIPQGM